MMEFRVHTKDRVYVTPIDTVADASKRFQQIARQGYYYANEEEVWIKIPYHAILKFEARKS